jgi:hypothetical protein
MMQRGSILVQGIACEKSWRPETAGQESTMKILWNNWALRSDWGRGGREGWVGKG